MKDGEMTNEITGHLTSLQKGPFDPQNLVKIRWLALAGQLVACLVIYFGFGFYFPLSAALGVIFTSALINLMIDQRNRSVKRVQPIEILLALSFDVIQLAALIYLTGGLLNPFFILLLAPIVVSAAILELRATLFLLLIVIISASLLSVYHLPLPWADASFAVPQLFLFGILLALIVSAIFISFYTWYLADNAREMASSLAKAQLALAKETEGLALGRLATAAAHKLGSPLNTISLISHDLVNDIQQDDPLYEDIQLLNTEIERCRIILSELDDDAHISSQRLAFALPVSEVVQSLTDGKIAEMTTKVTFEILSSDEATEPLIQSRPELKYALETILDNADGFAKAKILIRIYWDKEHLYIAIIDDGPGFKQSILNRSGQPFNSTRKGQNGHRGLGLYLAMSLIENAGGEMRIGNHHKAGISASEDKSQTHGRDENKGGRVVIRLLRAYIEDRATMAKIS